MCYHTTYTKTRKFNQIRETTSGRERSYICRSGDSDAADAVDNVPSPLLSVSVSLPRVPFIAEAVQLLILPRQGGIALIFVHYKADELNERGENHFHSSDRRKAILSEISLQS